MKLDRRHVLAGGAALAAFAAASPAYADVRRTGGGRAHGRALTALNRYVEQHRADWGLPGLSVCVVDRDGFAGFITSGYANLDGRIEMGPDHVLQVGSISKVFTALTAHSLAQESKLDPRARLHDLLPDVAIRDSGDITIQHLLNHTAGLPADAPLFPDGGLWSGFAPGSHWSYSNTGYELAGMCAARGDGRLLHEAIEARVLHPLGMTHSYGAIRSGDRARYAQGYEPLHFDRANIRPGPMGPAPWVDMANGAGSVASTAGDMALFLRFLLELAGGRGGPVLSDEMAARFMADPADAPGWSEHAKYGNGLARLRIDERDYLHHTGGMVSFCSSMHLDTQAGVAAFASSNVSYQLNYRPRAVTLHACQLLRAAREGGEAPVPAPTRPGVVNAGLYPGTYVAASGERFDIRVNGEQIGMRRDGRESEMQAAGGLAFACREPRFAVSGLLFEAEDDKIVRAWAHATEFLREGAATGYKPPAPAELQALAGRYDNDDRWAGPVTVVARDGRLWLHNFEPLTPLPDGSWRVGADDWSPERARFIDMIEGRPSCVLLSGAPYVRRFS